jgi:hypothetical protein
VGFNDGLSGGDGWTVKGSKQWWWRLVCSDLGRGEVESGAEMESRRYGQGADAFYRLGEVADREGGQRPVMGFQYGCYGVEEKGEGSRRGTD